MKEILTSRNKRFSFLLLILFSTIWGISCTDKNFNTPKIMLTSDEIAEEYTGENGSTTTAIQDSSAQIPDQIVLPVTRQVAPSDIQAQVKWFDGGAGARGIYTCQMLQHRETKNIEVLYRYASSESLYGEEWKKEPNQLREGEALQLCAFGFPSTSSVKWTLESDTLGQLTYDTQSDINGVAEFAPQSYFRPGIYKVQTASDDIILETRFEILPAKYPGIWLSGDWRPGNVLKIHYSGFAPSERVTTVWYVMSSVDQATYLTSWETLMDDSGYASKLVRIPSNMYIPYSILAAQGREISNKRWEIRRGFGLDLPASTIKEIEGVSNYAAEEWADDQYLVDNSSRLLKQVSMGTIDVGETKPGALASIYEAHNWVFSAQGGEVYLIAISFLHNDFPAERVSVIDPKGNLVYECGHVYYGCMSPDDEGVRYEPEVSGDFIIRLDMFNEGNGAYSISIKSLRDESEIAPHEIIIDDLDERLWLGGPSAGWRTAPFGYKGQTHWTYCTDEGVSNWGKWIPQLPVSGDYEVFVFVPEHKAGTKHARYRIFHNGVDDESVVRQTDYTNEWVSLGTYEFSANGEEYVYLDDNTGEARSRGITIGFDAVKFAYIP